MLNLKVGRGFDLLIEGECHGKIVNRPRHQGVIKMPTLRFPANPIGIPSIERRHLPTADLHGAFVRDKVGVLISAVLLRDES